MKLMINNSSMVPIYEQLVEQIKGLIVKGELTADSILPSVRGLSGELKISALTVKKAYDALEEEGLVVTVHGKGTYVAKSNQNLLREEQTKEVEKLFAEAVERGKRYGLTMEELRDLFEIIMEG
ncbi:MAG: GntR family transcriptional regulator [Butyrivibrio sp.]|nr:GntR family transcriptional regulator [Muribaculum sp.]MCM1551639.1 GntR family transcriptional regulator [Butyrivibrio sp.]